MSENAKDVRPEPQDILEPSARALCLYIVRIALLPWNMLLIKPSQIAEAAQNGDYRPLPPPYLLTLIAGVAVSGVVLNLPLLFADSHFGVPDEASRQAFMKGVTSSMTNAGDLGAVLLAVPYIAAIWIFSGLVSFSRGQGFRNVEPMFAFMSFSVTAIIHLGLVGLVLAQMTVGETDEAKDNTDILFGVMFILIIGLFLVLVGKLGIFLWKIGSKQLSSWIGLFFGFLLGLLVLSTVVLVALVPASLLLEP